MNVGNSNKLRWMSLRLWLLLSVSVVVATIAIVYFHQLGWHVDQPNPDRGRFVNELGIEFVWIPAGNHLAVLPISKEFVNKSDVGSETTTVAIDGFWISKYELTQEQCHLVDGFSSSTFPGLLRPIENFTTYCADGLLDQLNNSAKKHGLNVSYRYPNELEWEYACNGSLNDDLSNLSINEASKRAWFDRNSGSKTHDVGTLQPNSRGLHDMYGNVAELCIAGPDEYYDNTLIDFGFVTKGGSWSSPLSEFVYWNRRIGLPSDPAGIIGVRLVMVQERTMSKPDLDD